MNSYVNLLLCNFLRRSQALLVFENMKGNGDKMRHSVFLQTRID